MSREISLAIVGLGGIGSHLTKSLLPALSRGNLSKKLGKIVIHLYDSDIINEKNLMHQGFNVQNIGNNKASVLENELKSFINSNITLKGIRKDIRKSKELLKYDIIIVCVDSSPARMAAHEKGGIWLDLRCRGDCFIALDYRVKENIILDHTNSFQLPGSCQFEGAFESGNIQFGHLSAASFGCQWAIQHLRLMIEDSNVVLPTPRSHSITFGTLEQYYELKTPNIEG